MNHNSLFKLLINILLRALIGIFAGFSAFVPILPIAAIFSSHEGGFWE